jgi:hypothetical protein
MITKSKVYYWALQCGLIDDSAVNPVSDRHLADLMAFAQLAAEDKPNLPDQITAMINELQEAQAEARAAVARARGQE